METTFKLRFIENPLRGFERVEAPIKHSGYRIPKAERAQLENLDAGLYRQAVKGWQFTMHLYTADVVRGQTLSIDLDQPQVLFIFQLNGRLNRLLHGGAPFGLEKGEYCGCYLPKGEHMLNLGPGLHETLVFGFPYGCLVWLAGLHPALAPLVAAWKANSTRSLCLLKANIRQDERRTIARATNCHKPTGELDGALKMCLSRLLGFYQLQLAQQAPHEDAAVDMLPEVQHHLETHFADARAVTLSAVAERFGLTASTLRKKYVARYGLTMAAAVTALRIKAAQRLLHDTELTLEAIAEQAGFEYAQSLCRAFKLFTGVTPADYRAQH